ncbi:hypothetical protein EP331_12495 [bacterium]|nr:MAG: hypothetical protein EP331_12495 [bacterium]
MVIGVIGASLAGLAAARILGQQGHQVTVFEKSDSWSGRFTTLEVGAEKTLVDVNAPYLVANHEAVGTFFKDLEAKGLVKPIESKVKSYVNGEFANASMKSDAEDLYASTKGMKSIAQFLGRYTDVKFGGEAIGITYIGNDRGKKAPWMINLASFEVFELDAVVVALPAPQARQIIENAQDESIIRKAMAAIHEIGYVSRASVVATYPGKSLSDFNFLEIAGLDVELVVNESAKSGAKDLVLTIHSTDEFYSRAETMKDNLVIDHLLKQAADVIGDFVYNPEHSVLSKRKYVKPYTSLPMDFYEVKGLQGKLALVGDYFNGTSIETSIVSGEKLAKSWLV